MSVNVGDCLSPPSPEEPDFVSSFPELSPTQRRALLLEQLSIERKACLREISALRNLLQQQGIDDTHITSWLPQSDSILDTLLRYGLGKSGKFSRTRLLYRPWSWRRKCRNHFS